eukprot:scaffold21693_cov69-Amphora_coffeaeformis.AAC.1
MFTLGPGWGILCFATSGVGAAISGSRAATLGIPARRFTSPSTRVPPPFAGSAVGGSPFESGS